MDDSRINTLAKAPIPQAIMKMAIPSVIGLMVSATYNIVDTMFVSWLGTQATGATQVVFPMVMAFSAIGLAFGIGGGSFISRLLGAKNKHRAEQVLITALISSATLGILLAAAVIIFLQPVLTLFGATHTIMETAKIYGLFIAIGFPFQVANVTMHNLLRGEGSSLNSLYAMGTGTILNIILDPVLIFGLNMGIAGAAVATSFSQMITMIMLLRQYLGKKTILHFNLNKISYDRELIWELFKIGCPTFFRQILISVALGLMNYATAMYAGDIGIASIGIVIKVGTFITMAIFGLSQGFQVVAGFNYGAKEYSRVKKSIWFTISISLAFAIITCGLLIVFDNQILSIFQPSAEVLYFCKQFIVWYSLSLVFLSISNVISVYYQAIGKAKHALILSVSRQGTFFIPAILILPMYFGVFGIIITPAVADVLTFLLCLTLFIPSYRDLCGYEISSFEDNIILKQTVRDIQ